MENTITGARQEVPTAYDYRMYDRVWQRVSPDLNPYPDVRAAGEVSPPPAPAPVPSATPPAVPVPAMEGGGNGEDDNESNLPGAEQNPCCMGTEAQESLGVLEGFIEEELAERRCCQALSCRIRNQHAARLLRRIAQEKQCAARELSTAYYLITGSCYAPSVTVEHMQWASVAEALRYCYHQEACNAFNYQRAADATVDLCLQKLFSRLSEQSYCRAEEVMSLLGQMIC